MHAEKKFQKLQYVIFLYMVFCLSFYAVVSWLFLNHGATHE